MRCAGWVHVMRPEGGRAMVNKGGMGGIVAIVEDG